MKYKLFSFAFATVLVLTGCQGNDNQEGMNNNDRTGTDNIEQTRYDRDNRMNEGVRDNNRNEAIRNSNRLNEGIRDNTNNNRTDNYPKPQNNRTNNDNNDRYDVSAEAADRIVDQIDEIDSAYVLTTNNNAYVAAILDNDRKLDDNANRSRGADKVPNNREKDDKRKQDRNTDTIMNNDDDLTDEVKRKISDIVRTVDDDIDNVYVSTNPDFVDLTNNYINDFNEGRPVRGLFDQIGDMIERVFPQNRR